MTKKSPPLIILFSYLLATSSLAWAQLPNESSIEIYGLTIPCRQCELIDDPCKVSLAEGSLFEDCKVFLKDYLQQIQNLKYLGKSPSIVEIKKYLYSNEADIGISSQLVFLMTQIETGARLLLTDGQFLIKDHQRSIAQAIQDNKAVPILGEGLWGLSLSNQIDLSSETLASIAATNPDVSFEDLFDILSKRGNKSIEQLAKIEYLFRRSGQLIVADQLHEAIITIDECLDNISSCKKEDFSSLSASVAQYFKALKEEALISVAPKIEESDPSEMVNTVRSFAGGASLSTEGQALIVEALAKARVDEFDTARRRFVRPELLKMLRDTAKRNDEVARELSELLIKVSKESVQNGELKRSFESLKTSLEVYPQVLDSRSRLIIDLQTDARVQQNPGAKKILDSLLNPKRRKNLLKKKNKKTENKLNPIFLVMFVFVAGLLWAMTLFSYFRKQRNIEIEDEQAHVDLDIWRKDRDKRQLRAFFELEADSTEDDLIRNYRIMAKAIHPDGSGENTGEEFRELADLFEQARRLLFKRS